MRLTGRRVSLLLLLLAVGNVAAQSKDDEESVDAGHHGHVEGSGNAPSDDEDTVERVQGSGLPPSQVYTKLTTIVHARPVVPVKPTTIAPEVPKKKDPLPPIINMDAMDKEQKEKEKSVSIAPAIPRFTTNAPEAAGFVSTGFLIGILATIVVLIIVVIVIIVVCRNKHKDYTPARQDPR